MRYTYAQQAQGINTIIKLASVSQLEITDFPESFEAAIHGVTSLNALALVGDKRIIENERLRQIVEDFCAADPDMHRGEILAYQQDMKKIIGI